MKPQVYGENLNKSSTPMQTYTCNPGLLEDQRVRFEVAHQDTRVPT